MYNYIKDIESAFKEAGIQMIPGTLLWKNSADISVDVYDVKKKDDIDGILRYVKTYANYLNEIGETFTYFTVFEFDKKEGEGQYCKKKGEVYYAGELIKKDKVYRDSDYEKFTYVFNKDDTVIVGLKYKDSPGIKYMIGGTEYTSEIVDKSILECVVERLICNYCSFALADRSMYENIYNGLNIDIEKLYNDVTYYQGKIIDRIVSQAEAESSAYDEKNTVSAFRFMNPHNGKLILWHIRDDVGYSSEKLETKDSEDAEEVDKLLYEKKLDSTEKLVDYLLKKQIKPYKKEVIKMISEYTECRFSIEEITEAQQEYEKYNGFSATLNRLKDRMSFWYFDTMISNRIADIDTVTLSGLSSDKKRKEYVDKLIQELLTTYKGYDIKKMFSKEKTRIKYLLEDKYTQTMSKIYNI